MESNLLVIFLVFEVQVDNKQFENTKFSVSDKISNQIQVFLRFRSLILSFEAGSRCGLLIMRYLVGQEERNTCFASLALNDL